MESSTAQSVTPSVGSLLHNLGVLYRATPHFPGKWRVLKWVFENRFKGGRRTDLIQLNAQTMMQCNFCSGYGVWSEGERYERIPVAYFRHLLKPGMTFLDVGTNVGYYSLLAAPLVGHSGSIHSFEPVSSMYEMLCGNIKRNNIRTAIANRMIVSDTVGQKTIHLAPEDNCGSGSLSFVQRTDGRTETVESTTLDAYMNRQALKRVDVIKIDAEGEELNVLKGARLMLSEKRPILMVEVRDRLLKESGASRAELYSFLKDMGYSAFKIKPGAQLEPIIEPCDGELIVFKPVSK